MTFWIVDTDTNEYREGYLCTEEPFFDIWDGKIVAKCFEAETIDDAKKVLSAYNHYADKPVTVLHCCSTGCCVSTYAYYHDTFKCMMCD